MKADLVSPDAARVERGRYGEFRRTASRPGTARAVLVGAGLAMIAGGIVSSALWFVWQLAEIVPFDDAAAGEAAAVYRDLSRSGRVIGKADLYVAGICLASGARLVTRNVREYGRVAGLQLVKV